MLTLLAQIPTPAPGTTEGWLWSAAALCAIALTVKKLFTKTPPDDDRYASKGEHIELKLRVDQMDLKHREDIKLLFGKLDKISDSVSRIEGRLIEQDRNS